MLTRLRVKGFKNLLDVELYFGPFTCLAGQNGAGKSNIFDAIRFLNLLAQYPIMEAATRLRETKGRSPNVKSLFTAFKGYRAPRMFFEADIIVEPDVVDEFGAIASAAKTALRYTLVLKLNEDERPARLEIVRESLAPIKNDVANEKIAFRGASLFLKSGLQGSRRIPFISQSKDESGKSIINVHQDQRSGRLRKHLAHGSLRTAISGISTVEYPTVLAVRREMESWRTLLLEPSVMRAPSSYRDPRNIDSRGGNLPATIYRLQTQEELPGSVCAELANRLSELVDDVRELRIVDDEKTETLTLEVKDQNGVFHPARSLSDGTLRFLVLATLFLDPQAKGVICLEEPENGIHPDRIPAIVELLKDIAVDPVEELGLDNPLRQVMVNTHSPYVFENCSPAEDVVYITSKHVKRKGHAGNVCVTAISTESWRGKVQPDSRRLSPGEAQSYLGFTIPSPEKEMWLEFIGE